MSTNRKSPYTHPDGSNCWTKNCRLGHVGDSKEAFIREVIQEQRTRVTKTSLVSPADAPNTLVSPFGDDQTRGHVNDIASAEAFAQAVEEQLINRGVHPEMPYSIYKYAMTTPYKKAWNDVTLASRGLIINDETGEIVARPFPKFFNLAEGMTPEELMTGPFEVTEKEDGSLGILFEKPDGTMALTTAGSLNTPQGAHATALYNERYHGQWEPRPGYTYLYEIIAPDNRIVIDYGDMNDLVLLGAVHKKTGKTLPVSELNEWPGPRPTIYNEFSSLSDIASSPDRVNKEGYIVHFTETDTRVKVKHDEYVRLHRSATGLNPRRVWETLFHAQTLEEEQRARAVVDVDFLDYYDEQVGLLTKRRNEIVKKTDTFLAEVKSKLPADATKREVAAMVLSGNNDLSKDERKLVNGITLQKWEAEQRGDSWVMSDWTRQRLWAVVKPPASKAKFFYQNEEDDDK